MLLENSYILVYFHIVFKYIVSSFILYVLHVFGILVYCSLKHVIPPVTCRTMPPIGIVPTLQTPTYIHSKPAKYALYLNYNIYLCKLFLYFKRCCNFKFILKHISLNILQSVLPQRETTVSNICSHSNIYHGYLS